MRGYSIVCDLKESKFIKLKYAQNDAGLELEVKVVEDNKDVDLTNCSIEARYKRADNVVVKRNISSITNNTFIAKLDSEITKVSGVLKMSFTIKKGSVQLSTFLVLGDIKEIVSEETSPDTPTGSINIPITVYNDETGLEEEIIITSTGGISEVTLEEVAE